MGTTKLTRKQIADDPIHDMLVSIVEVVRSRARLLGLAAAGIVLVGAGVYFGLGYLEAQDMRAQQDLAKGMAFYHAQVDPSASDDPYAKGSVPVFKSKEAMYEAAAKEFSAVTSRYRSSKSTVIAQYYLGLSQWRLGRKEEALKTLEAVRNNTKDRTLSYLAKKVLATYYFDTGKNQDAQELLEGMIKDPQCELPKDDLKVALSRVYVAQGNRDEALQLLREARDSNEGGLLQSQVYQELRQLEADSPESQRP